MVYCVKHEMPCRNGCLDLVHLKNQDGCLGCEAAWAAKARHEKEAAKKEIQAVKKNQDDAFWKTGKERKKAKD
jgi:hypothetical protein